MKVPPSWIFIVTLFTGLWVQLVRCSASSVECSASLVVAIDENQTSCSRKTRSASNSLSSEWLCADLQTALMLAVDLTIGKASQLGNGTQDHQNISTDCVSILLPPGDHFITAPVHFGAANVSIFGTGTQSSDVSVFCDYTVDVDESRIFNRSYNYTDYTFYFNRSEVVSLERLQFIGCPYPLRLDTVATVDVHNSTFRNFTEAVFDIFNCASVSITDSTFTDNSGTGISRHPFRANTGAVAIGYSNVPKRYPQVTARVVKCNFTRNRATAADKVRTTSAAFFSRIFSGRGGGLGVFFDENFYNILLDVHDNHFMENYAKSFGGALYLVTFGEGTQNQYNVSKNKFVNNFAPLGGGAISNTFFSNGVPDSPHQLLMTDCLFKGNVGQSGGALSLYLPYGVHGVSYIRCERCIFIENHGNNTNDEYGAAIAIYRVNQFESRESVPRYDFIDCTFENNSGNNGIFTVSHFPLSFSGNTTFSGNKVTDSLTIIGSLVEFSGNVLFSDNADSSTNSVALHLLSFAQVQFNPGLKMTFSDNDGNYGASVLVDTPTASTTFNQLAYNPQCFVLYENESLPPAKWDNVSVSFRRNKAALGSSLLISRLETCSWVSQDSDPSFIDTNVYDWPIWDYGNDSVNTAYTDPYSAEHSFVTVARSLVTTNKSVTAWPGQQFFIQLTALDQFGRKTTTAARFRFNSLLYGDVVVTFSPELVVIYASSSLSLVRNFKLTYSVSSGEALKVNRPLGNVTIDNPVQSVDVTTASILLYTTLCPAGYVLRPTGQNKKGLECQCNSNNTFIKECEGDQDRILVEEGYWGQAVNVSTNYRFDLFLHPCPPAYCKCSQNTSLGSTRCAFTYTNSDPDAQCVNERRGIFCGECRDGKGVSVLLNNCVSCHNAQGLLILALIIADVIAFTVIVVVDNALPEWSYPFIFYIQAVSAIATSFPLSFITGGKFLLFVSSALNFYFVYDFCLYNNMSPLFSYFLRYFPIFLFLLLLPAVAVFRQRRMLMLKHHGIWWIIVLLYTHLVHTSMSILQCPLLPNSSVPRWFVSGNIGCFTRWHIPLSLLAIVALVAAALLIPLTYLVSRKQDIIIKKFYWLKYFQAPLTCAYKDEWRWWSAIELARRFIFVLCVIPFPRNSESPLFVMCVILAVYGMCQPYKSRATNIMEIVLQVNFIFLLTLQSSGYLKDVYNVFPVPELNTSTINTNVAPIFNGNITRIISSLAKLLLPFYYLPLLLFIVTAIVYLVVYIRKKRATRNVHLLAESCAIEQTDLDPVTMTELKLVESGDYVHYKLVTDTET